VTPSTTQAADLEGQSAFMPLLGVHVDQTHAGTAWLAGLGWGPTTTSHGAWYTAASSPRHRDLRHRRGRHSLRGLPEEAWLRQALDNAWSLP